MRRARFFIAAAALGVMYAQPQRAHAAAPAIGFDARGLVPVVRVLAGGRALRLAIDTGNAASRLSLAAAVAAGVRGARGTLHGVTLAGETLRDHPVDVADVSSWTALVGSALDGLLGYEAFRDRAIALDYPNRRLVFPDAIPDGERATITWLQYDDRSPQLVTFDGLSIDGFPVTAQFDTAMSKNAIVFTAKLPDLVILPENRASAYAYAGATLSPGSVGSLRLGTTLLAARALVYDAGADAHVPTTAIAAVVGDQLFVNRVVTLDFPSSTLIVT